MEHRCAERVKSELKILIYKHNHPVAIGRINNGSRHGVFVETDFMDIDCEHQLKLEVMLSKNNYSKFKRIEMEAIVIHKTPRGFGAEIEFPNTQQADMFMEIMRGAKKDIIEEPVLALVV